MRLDLIKHSFAVHSMEPAFHFVCGIRGCLHSFRFGSTFSSFKSHASRKHPNWQESVNDEATHTAPSPPPLVPSLDPNHAVVQHQDHDVEGSTANADCNVEPVVPVTSEPITTATLCPPSQRAAGLFLLTFQERYKLPQTAINFAVGLINMIVDGVCESVQSSSATDTTARFNEREDPFAPLQTEYMQSKFYREHFGLVVSCILLYSYT